MLMISEVGDMLKPYYLLKHPHRKPIQQHILIGMLRHHDTIFFIQNSKHVRTEMSERNVNNARQKAPIYFLRTQTHIWIVLDNA